MVCDFSCWLSIMSIYQNAMYGDRANYAYLDKKQNLRTYVDRWCIGRIGTWLFSGPPEAISDLRSMRPIRGIF